MCKFSNNNQSATYNPLDNQQTTPTTLQLIKMAAELAAIDNAADTDLFSPIPISAIFHVNVGDFIISCNITNNAAREDVDHRNKQATAQQSQQKSETTQQSQQKSETTQQSQQKSETTQQSQQKSETTQQYDMFRQLPEKYHKLYSVVTDYLGSYTKVKINIAPNVTRDAVKITFINKGVSTAATNYPFFGVESVKDQKYFEKNFKHFSVYPNGDAFCIAVSTGTDEEMYLNRFMQMIRDNIRNNKREVIWGRYN